MRFMTDKVTTAPALATIVNLGRAIVNFDACYRGERLASQHRGLGRVERPRSTAADRAGQPYLAAAGRPRVGAWLCRALRDGRVR